jgi:hypothetical protein
MGGVSWNSCKVIYVTGDIAQHTNIIWKENVNVAIFGSGEWVVQVLAEVEVASDRIFSRQQLASGQV